MPDERFRTDTHVGRTIYINWQGIGDCLVGMLDTADLAQFAVDSMNKNLDELPAAWKEETYE